MTREASVQIVAVVGVIVRGDRVLTLRRSAIQIVFPHRWETVSGRVEIGEDPLAAVRREIAEETGLDVELEDRPLDAYAAKRGEEPMVVIVYRAVYRGGEVRLSPEHDAFEYVTAADFRAKSGFDRLADAVDRALSVR